jgi:hypothetical protein
MYLRNGHEIKKLIYFDLLTEQQVIFIFNGSKQVFLVVEVFKINGYTKKLKLQKVLKIITDLLLFINVKAVL